MKKLITLLIIILSGELFGQDSNCLTIHLKRKSKKIFMKQRFNVNDFFLVKNCMYDFEMQNEKQYSAKLIDIKKDTIVFTTYFNSSVAQSNYDKLDTIKTNISNLKKIRLIEDRMVGAYNKISLIDYLISFEIDCNNCKFEPEFIKIKANDSTKYEIVPLLTAQGYNSIYEEKGRTYFYSGDTINTEPEKADTTYRVRNFAWFTPNYVEEINGLAIGFSTENIKNDFSERKDSLKISGLNIELMPLGVIWIFSGTIFNNPPELIENYERYKNHLELKIYGVNLSLSGTIKTAKINGVNISGLSTSVVEINGLSLSGFNTFTYVMNGVNISGVQNIAVKCKGVQIALFNRAKELKGVQIGLWNNNGKFSFPLINFRF